MLGPIFFSILGVKSFFFFFGQLRSDRHSGEWKSNPIANISDKVANNLRLTFQQNLQVRVYRLHKSASWRVVTVKLRPPPPSLYRDKVSFSNIRSPAYMRSHACVWDIQSMTCHEFLVSFWSLVKRSFCHPHVFRPWDVP